MSEWYGDLCQGWQDRYLSQMCDEQCNKNIGNAEDNVLSLSYGQIIRKKNKYGGLVPSDFSTYQIVDKGNIILRLTDLQNDHTSLRTGLVRERGIITSAYCCLNPWESPKYLQYLLHAYDTQKHLYGLGGGVRQSIGYKDIRYIHLPLPPRAEQEQIVRYLDWKVSGVNRLINAKKKQIVLLQEQKRAVINEAVTKGGWTTQRLKTVLNEMNDTVGEQSADYVLLSLTKGGVIIRDLSTGKGKFPSDFGTYKIVKPGQIIFCLFDVDETPRTVGLSYNHGMITGAYDVFDIKGIEPKFLEYYFLAIDDVKGLKPLYTGLRKVVNKDRFLQMQIPIPSEAEQLSIVERLDNLCKKIDAIANKLNDEISLLQEYRTRLISDVVTGKLDVRDVIVPDYEAVEETANAIENDLEETEGGEE